MLNLPTHFGNLLGQVVQNQWFEVFKGRVLDLNSVLVLECLNKELHLGEMFFF